MTNIDLKMINPIIGDIVGQYYDFKPIKTTDFAIYTDTTFTTNTLFMIAIMNSCNVKKTTYQSEITNIISKYPNNKWDNKLLRWYYIPSINPSIEDNTFYNRLMVLYYKNPNEVINDILLFNYSTSTLKWGNIFIQICNSIKSQTKEQIKNIYGQYFPLDFDINEFKKAFRYNTDMVITLQVALKIFLDYNDFISILTQSIALGGNSSIISSISLFFYELSGGKPDIDTANWAITKLDSNLNKILLKFNK